MDSQSPPNPNINNSPENQPKATAGYISSSQPTVILGNNESTALTTNSNSKLVPILVVIISIILVCAALLYFWILPTSWSNKYLKNIKSSYQQQTSQMQKVYQDFNDIGTTNNASENAQQAYNSISNEVQSTINSTNYLKSKNTLIILPGATWLHATSVANTDQITLTKYINDSQAFLQDYKLLVNYSWKFDQILKTQLPIWVSDTNAINKGAQTSTFITVVQNTNTDLQNFINNMTSLKPPADLQVFNQNFISDLNTIDSSLTTQIQDIRAGNTTDYNNQKATYVSAYLAFGKLLSTNALANIKTSSVIADQLKVVKADNPLQ